MFTYTTLITPPALAVQNVNLSVQNVHLSVPISLTNQIASPRAQIPPCLGQVFNFTGFPINQKVPSPSKYILNYTIEFQSILGKGNFSHVYRCTRNTEPTRPLAVKILSIQSLRQQQLQNLIKSQVQILKIINHKNLISCKDVYWDDFYYYIFTEFYQENLEDYLKKIWNNYGGWFNVPERQFYTIIKDIVEGMVYLEKLKIVHRDIKPANIFIKDGRAVIADLGFARFYNQLFHDLQMGSAPYMSPQSITQNLYHSKTDVWSFGVMIFQIFHGQGPYLRSFDRNDLIKKILTPLSVISLRSNLTIEMKKLILCCLEINYQRRARFCQIQHSWFYQKLFCSQKQRQRQLNRPTTTYLGHSSSLTNIRSFTPDQQCKVVRLEPRFQPLMSPSNSKRKIKKNPSCTGFNNIKIQNHGPKNLNRNLILPTFGGRTCLKERIKNLYSHQRQLNNGSSNTQIKQIEAQKQYSMQLQINRSCTWDKSESQQNTNFLNSNINEEDNEQNTNQSSYCQLDGQTAVMSEQIISYKDLFVDRYTKNIETMSKKQNATDVMNCNQLKQKNNNFQCEKIQTPKHPQVKRCGPSETTNPQIENVPSVPINSSKYANMSRPPLSPSGSKLIKYNSQNVLFSANGSPGQAWKSSTLARCQSNGDSTTNRQE